MVNVGGNECDNWQFAYKNRCKHDPDWSEAKWCQYSCFANGAGYPGDNCCVQQMRAGDLSGGDRTDTSALTADPTASVTLVPTAGAPDEEPTSTSAPTAAATDSATSEPTGI
mmetsp:Transcript_26523/g.53856  ORF Transcript_26523/g.53856 Transcript_26523/m.53856 type:complete len:112 (-) Transcript_26523:539-874(-)